MHRTGIRTTPVVLFALSLALVSPALTTAAGQAEVEEAISLELMGVTSMPRFSASIGRPAPFLSCSDREVLTAPTHATVVGSAAVEEALRLMEAIHEERCGIEDERATALRSVDEAYRENRQAIAPKDMFESEAEYHARDAREKSEVELQRVVSINHVHRTHDDRLRQDVEPLIRRVEELLSSEDIVPRDAIQFHLETYDAESQLFHGILKIDSPIVPTDSLIHFPMKRADARIFWRNRQSHEPIVRVSLDLWSLSIKLARFSIDDPDSGMTTTVFVVSRPPVGQLPAGKANVVSAIRASSENLTNSIAGQSSIDTDEAEGFRAEYNRLLREAKSVFVNDAFVQGLQEIDFEIGYDNRYQAAGAIRSAAVGLAAYLKSFVPSEGFKASTESLVAFIAEDSNSNIDTDEAGGFRAEYNRLLREAKSVFVSDAFVQGLQEIDFEIGYDNRYQAAEAVAGAARSLGRVVANISEVPTALGVDFTDRASTVAAFDYLPYSGRFSKEAVTFEGDLRRRFSTSATNESGVTDLHFAAGRDLPGLASALLDAGADFRARDHGGSTPLHWAAGALVIAADLIGRGAAVDTENDGGWTPLHFAAWTDARVRVVELLIGQGADVDAPAGDDGWTPLDLAIYSGASESAELLRRHGASCNSKC